MANSAYILLVTSLIPIYFHEIAKADGLSETEYLAYWSIAASLVTFIMLFIGPALGSTSDRRGWRKPIFMATVITGVLSCVVLGLPKWWILFLIIFCIGKIAYNASLVIYDGMLIDVAKDDEMDALSSKGYAMGYIGSCLPFLACMALVVLSDFMEDFPTIMTFYDAVMWSLVITGVWWLVMSLPLFRNYEQTHFNEVRTRTVKENLSYVAGTVKDIAKNKAIWLFFLAFFFYIDGVNTIIEVATAFGEAKGLGSVGLLGALLLTQIIAFPSTLIMNKLAYKYGTHRVIGGSILGYLLISIYAMFLDDIVEFFIMAGCVGLFQGTIQALSRSYFGRMIPKEKTGEYFGILDIFSKGSTIIGTASIAILAALFNSTNSVPVVLIIVFGIGFVLFCLSVKEHVYDSPTGDN
ncbi:MAG: MFS transporter [Candidatus Methanomethylophilaceae archaeon]|nr:MFS transporter [Candidatus Methanomethylophilaceae archaeon]